MKFWKKIFLNTIILTMILINCGGFIVIERIHKRNLDRAISEGIENQKNIINSIYLNYDSTYNEFQNLEDVFNIILKSYIYTNDYNLINILIYDSENILIASSNREIGGGIKPESLSLSERNFMIETINEEKILSVGSVFKVGNNEFKLVFSRSINDIYIDRKVNYKFFIFIDIILNIILITIMYVISKHLTKPIVEIANASIDISMGDYNKRVKWSDSNDEVGILSNNFNEMMDVLELKIKELNELNEEKERFINNFTHEIKTPITSIIGYSDLLLNGNINEDIRIKALKYINNEGKRIENLTSSLMKLILIKAGNLEKKHVSISQCVNRAISSLTYKANEKGIIFTSDVSEGNMEGDVQLIITLVVNLIDNAIKACKNGGIINISNKIDSKENYKLIITDNGIGISQEDLEKIKEPFYMVDKSRGRSENSLGLGLALCNEICRLYNIDFKINSELGKGTTVTLIFKMEGKLYEENGVAINYGNGPSRV